LRGGLPGFCWWVLNVMGVFLFVTVVMGLGVAGFRSGCDGVCHLCVSVGVGVCYRGVVLCDCNLGVTMWVVSNG
jgi:hypothetical protein